MKTKSILLLILTLIIGFVLGILTSSQIRFHKMRPVKVFFSEDRFREGFYNTIKPDDRQKSELDPILDRYAKINSDLQTTFRKEMESSIKNFRKEIDSKLTDEQLARLKEMDKKRQEMFRHGRSRHDHDYDRSHDTLRHHDKEFNSSSSEDSTGNK